MSFSKDRKEYHGVWHLAGQPTIQAHGVLRAVDDDCLQLTLTGSLGDVSIPGLDLPSGSHRIVGNIDGGRAVLLDGCIATSARGFPGVPRQTWHVHEAVFDAVFDATEPLAFIGIRLAMPMLSRWVVPGGVEQQFEWHPDGTVKSFGLAVPVDSFPLWNRDGIALKLVRAGSVRSTSETITQVESRFDLCIRAEQPTEAAELRHLGRPIQVLLGLASGKFTTPISSTALLPDAQGRYVDWKWQPIDTAAHNDVLYGFSYTDWRNVSGSRIITWLDTLEKIDPVLDLYLASLRQIGYAELSFLIIVQALETYHRRTTNDAVLSAGDWALLQSCLRETINEFAWMREDSHQWREVLLAKLEYFNEPSLPRRLRALFSSVDELAEGVAGGAVKKFVRRVVDTRNYYTHWDAKQEGSALRGAALFHASTRLLALLEVLLLRDVGFGAASAAVQDVLRRRVRWLPTAD